MKICLAGFSQLKKKREYINNSKYLLESFYSIEDWQIPFIKSSDLFLLDSGAFTFMRGNAKVDWADYIKRYAEFINKYDVKYFFELDIDNIVGYEKVLEYRKLLERLTQKKCIPVWHKSRGKDEFIRMCKEYDYVAIGGIVTKEIAKKDYKYMKPLINIAHKNNCKIHGLGFTPTGLLKEYHFDSVDSTNWMYYRYGKYWQIKNNIMVLSKHPQGKRCHRIDEMMVYNWNLWCSYQRYAKTHL